jgi:hypothetical protein
MKWAFALLFAASTMLPPTAFGYEVRRAWFPDTVIGIWGETAEKCKAKDGSNVLIARDEYGDATGTCEVAWIVETSGANGPNYAAHAQCRSAQDPTKTEIVNIIVRPQDKDRALMGRSSSDLKSYQRCTAE